MTPLPLTAAGLAAGLAAYAPVARPGGLEVTGLPADLAGPVRLLQTGVRAVLTSRPWLGCDLRTGRVVVLDPGRPVPREVGLLSVLGAAKWDRIPAAARRDFPAAFAAPPVRKPAVKRSAVATSVLDWRY